MARDLILCILATMVFYPHAMRGSLALRHRLFGANTPPILSPWALVLYKFSLILLLFSGAMNLLIIMP